jgi:hypothetical protein
MISIGVVVHSSVLGVGGVFLVGRDWNRLGGKKAGNGKKSPPTFKTLEQLEQTKIR